MMIVVRNGMLCRQHHFNIIGRFPCWDPGKIFEGRGEGGVLGIILFARWAKGLISGNFAM